jgi:hypothetical protein
MSDDETRPIEPDAPVPPQAPAQTPGSQAPESQAPDPANQPAPAYAMAVPPGYPAYAAQPRPRFADQVMGMRGVVATALACLIIGGLSGWILGHAAGSDDGRFGRGPGVFIHRGFPDGQNGFSNRSNGFPNLRPGQVVPTQPGQQPSRTPNGG